MITTVNNYSNNDLNGFLRVANKGAYVARCALGYKFNGQNYYQSVQYLPVLQSHLFTMPQGATNIVFETDIWVDFSLYTLIDIKKFNNTIQKCFYLWGTIFYYGCSETSCGGNGPSVGDPVPPINPTPPCCCCCCKCN